MELRRLAKTFDVGKFKMEIDRYFPREFKAEVGRRQCVSL